MTNVHLSPPLNVMDLNNGVGRVILAQHQHLPSYGINLTENPFEADVVAAHISSDNLPFVDVHHCHGILWTGDVGYNHLYDESSKETNKSVLSAAKKARVVTVPSEWVAMPFKRDMRISPVVIGHGLNLDEWEMGVPANYILWNKNRSSDVCDASYPVKLAERGLSVLTTHTPYDYPHALPPSLKKVGSVPHATMKSLVNHALFYLSTTQETFGIGTLEALASGVPVLGFNWGGTRDLVQHKVNGYLVDVGDIEGLIEGYHWLVTHRQETSKNARESALAYDWSTVMGKYAALYREVHTLKQTEPTGVSVVIPCYNYGNYLREAVLSCLRQTEQPKEIIIVNDGSTDNSHEVGLALAQEFPTVRYYQQPNSGVAATRNYGIALATQPYILCLDADDALESPFLETCATVLRKDRSLGVAYTGLKAVRDDGTDYVQPDWPPEFNWEKQCEPTNPPATTIPVGSVFRKDMWTRAGGYQQWCAPGEDAEFWTRGLSVGFSAKRVTSQGHFRYRLHANSASRTKTYKRIDAYHPWMTDKLYPMAAPAKETPYVRSYIRPMVSVIIPVGPTHEKYLPAALDSLLGQSFRGWECIVIADGYEPSLAWDRIQQVYPFITLLKTEKAHGPAFARNMGLDTASAPTVFFLDADDYLHPHALHHYLKAYSQENGRYYIFSDYVQVRGDLMEPMSVPEYNPIAWLHKGQHAVTVLIDTEKARTLRFNEAFKGWEDWDFFMRAAIQGFHGKRVAQHLFYYRHHTGTQRNQSFAQKDELLTLIDRLYGDYRKGLKPMASCCGGSRTAQEMIEIKRMLGTLEDGVASDIASRAIPNDGNGKVRMVFIGEERGEVMYLSEDGQRHYRAANNATSKYLDVDPRDVERLLNFGKFQVVRALRDGPIPPPPQEEPVQSVSVAQPQYIQPVPVTITPPIDVPTEVIPFPVPLQEVEEGTYTDPSTFLTPVDPREEEAFNQQITANIEKTKKSRNG